jgi:hypothetical protein
MTLSNSISSVVSLLIKAHFYHLTKIIKDKHTVECETGETTYEHLDLIAQDDPVKCADYAKQNNLLDTAGSLPSHCKQ